VGRGGGGGRGGWGGGGLRGVDGDVLFCIQECL